MALKDLAFAFAILGIGLAIAAVVFFRRSLEGKQMNDKVAVFRVKRTAREVEYGQV